MKLLCLNLGGLDAATILIKKVCLHLMTEHPSLHTFSTLSPIPGLCKWVQQCLDDVNTYSSGDRSKLDKDSWNRLRKMLDVVGVSTNVRMNDYTHSDYIVLKTITTLVRNDLMAITHAL